MDCRKEARMRKGRNWAFEAGFIVTAVIVGVGFSMKPWQAYREQSKLRDENVKEMKIAEKRSEALIREKARSESQIGREEMARRQGFMPPNERPIGD